jgi:Amt family ammonium transporter
VLTGVFAIEQYGGTAGVLEGNPVQFINQCIGVAIVFVYRRSRVADHPLGHQDGDRLRVTPEIEREGLDVALHGETVQ